MLLEWFRQLDRVLRGEATSPRDLRDGDIRIDLKGIAIVLVLLGIVAGLCTGSYAAVGGGDGWLQLLASGVKVPVLFLLTLVVTFPSLYVFNALVGSRLRLMPVLRLLVASLAVNITVLASLGPIVAFFGVSTSSYHFMVLLNVATFSLGGILGLMFLLQTLNRLVAMGEVEEPHEARIVQEKPAEIEPSAAEGLAAESTEQDLPFDYGLPPRVEAPVELPSPLEMAEGQTMQRHVRKVFALWIVVFALVGSQMGWVLRPFIGSPGQEFTWLRPRDSNFFEAVFLTIAKLFS